MRYCSKCKAMKELTEFYKSRSRKDGLQCYCKECCRKITQKYQQTETGKVVSRKGQQKYRQSEAGRAGRQNSSQKYRQLYPEKFKAHDAVKYAVSTGKLLRPNHCESCFKECRPEGHHEDYSKPLEVEWLCTECHIKQGDN